MVWTPDTRKDYASDMTGTEWEKIKPCLWLCYPPHRLSVHDLFLRRGEREIFSLLQPGCQWNMRPKDFLMADGLPLFPGVDTHDPVWECIHDALYRVARAVWKAGRKARR
ncbi:hypothetical protein SAMN05421754_100645 [Nitrosomonas sp. Nm58]|nr:hypothetical protein SAMN05421754_100645 [Nitrosomonas sp. Nm58]